MNIMEKTTYKFNSQIELGAKFQTEFTLDQIKNEPMLFSCNLKTAYELGGPLTNAFLNNLN